MNYKLYLINLYHAVIAFLRMPAYSDIYLFGLLFLNTNGYRLIVGTVNFGLSLNMALKPKCKYYVPLNIDLNKVRRQWLFIIEFI